MLAKSAINNIMAELSWPVRVKLMKYDTMHYPPSRRVGLSFFQAPKGRQGLGHGNQPVTFATAPEFTTAAVFNSHSHQEDDDNVKLKLFKLMYEAVRDTDVKIKRAELIQQFYNNSTLFEIGYLVGDIEEKHKSMVDLSDMLVRFKDEWKAVEHINAYEQIASRAVEISHIIEMAVTAIYKLKPDSIENNWDTVEKDNHHPSHKPKHPPPSPKSPPPPTSQKSSAAAVSAEPSSPVDLDESLQTVSENTLPSTGPEHLVSDSRRRLQYPYFVY